MQNSSEGPYSTIAGAFGIDGFSLFVTMLIAISVILVCPLLGTFLERESITYVVRKADFIFERMISHDLAKAEKGLTERQALEKRTEIEKERENRTVVEIQHNLEYGMWKIIGFESFCGHFRETLSNKHRRCFLSKRLRTINHSISDRGLNCTEYDVRCCI